MKTELFILASPDFHMDSLIPESTARAFIQFLDEVSPGHKVEAKRVRLQFDLTLEPEAEFKAFVSQA